VWRRPLGQSSDSDGDDDAVDVGDNGGGHDEVVGRKDLAGGAAVRASAAFVGVSFMLLMMLCEGHAV
jgi:hypothetical protein